LPEVEWPWFDAKFEGSGDKRIGRMFNIQKEGVR
jgi:hypothetical protein